MKVIFAFIRSTLIGGIFFLLPAYLVFTIVYKVHLLVVKILAPINRFLPDDLLGVPARNVVAIVALVLICFLAGILFRLTIVKKGIRFLEEKILSHLPGYTLLKSKTADVLNEKVDYYISAVLVDESGRWRIGLLIEEVDSLCTVFFPEAPNNTTGQVVVFPIDKVKKLDAPTKEILLQMKNFGKGSIEWIKQVK